MRTLFLHPTFELSEEALHSFSVLGRALYTAQRFEQNVKAVAKGFLILVGDKRQELSLEEALEVLGEKTLGGTEKDMLKRKYISEEGRQILKKARLARNEIAHDIATSADHDGSVDWDWLLGRLKDLCSDIVRADGIMCSIMHWMSDDEPLGDKHLAIHATRVDNWIFEDAY